MGIPIKVKPIPAIKYLTKAARPYNSRMSKAKLTENGFKKLPVWQEALQRYLKEIDWNNNK